MREFLKSLQGISSLQTFFVLMIKGVFKRQFFYFVLITHELIFHL